MLRLEEGKIVGGKYRLVRELARGGMGAVWVADDSQLGRQVAVKFMDASLVDSKQARARFEREARIVAQLSTPHVVQIFEHGDDEGVPFMVMELLHGEDLGARLKRVGRLPLPEAARIVQQSAKALRRAHALGIVHRDLKPANVFLASTGEGDDEETVKILDFGIAKSASPLGDGERTESQMLLGSPRYMSPEQARSQRDIDHRSDLFSLAVIAFRMVTGTQVFRGESLGDLILAICAAELPRATAVAPDLPPELDAFFERALQREPGARFQSARELAAAFAKAAVPGAVWNEASWTGTFTAERRAPLDADLAGAATRVTPAPASVSQTLTEASTTLHGAAPARRSRVAFGIAAAICVLAGGAAAVALGQRSSPAALGAAPLDVAASPAPSVSSVPSAAPGAEPSAEPSARGSAAPAEPGPALPARASAPADAARPVAQVGPRKPAPASKSAKGGKPEAKGGKPEAKGSINEEIGY